MLSSMFVKSQTKEHLGQSLTTLYRCSTMTSSKAEQKQRLRELLRAKFYTDEQALHPSEQSHSGNEY
jgi:hypothetical protein